MALIIVTPESIYKSWRKGTVTVVLKDATTQHSTVMHHAVELVHQLKVITDDEDILLHEY